MASPRAPLHRLAAAISIGAAVLVGALTPASARGSDLTERTAPIEGAAGDSASAAALPAETVQVPAPASAPASAPAPAEPAAVTTKPRPSEVEGPAAAPSPAPATPTPPPPPAKSKWLRSTGIASLSGGLGLFVLFYMGTAITGIAVHDVGQGHLDDPALAERGRRQINAGKRLVIPLAGPFLAFPYLDSDGREGAAIAGGFQLFGIVAAIAGAIQLGVYAKINRPRPQAALQRRFHVTGLATPRSAAAALVVRF